MQGCRKARESPFCRSRPIVDDEHVFEYNARWAKNIVCALARIDGRPVGIVANQPKYFGGVIDTAACEKSTRFVEMCDAFGLPLISLIDVPGVLIGPQAEKVREFLTSQSAVAETAGLRVGVRGGGCSGFQYALAFDEPTAEDGLRYQQQDRGKRADDLTHLDQDVDLDDRDDDERREEDPDEGTATTSHAESLLRTPARGRLNDLRSRAPVRRPRRDAGPRRAATACGVRTGPTR